MHTAYDTVFSLYVHVPFCVSRCDYCDFFSSVPSCIEHRSGGGNCLNPVFEERYVSALVRQLVALCQTYTISQWRSVYIGGGTPGLLSAAAISHLLNAVRDIAPLSPRAEITVEVNPEDCTQEWLSDCFTGGVNRISVGIQSFNNDALCAVNRRTSVAANTAVLSLLTDFSHEHNHFRWSADLIAGLPEENADTFAAGVTNLLSYHPNHVSLYTLSLEKETPLYRRLSKNGHSLAAVHRTNDTSDALWFIGRDLLQNAGLFQYEVSNFAVSGYESVHNSAYWTQKNWLGIGPGASGSVFYDDGTGMRQNVPADVALWFEHPEITEHEILDLKTCMKEFLMTGFRLRAGINTDHFEKRFGCCFQDCVSPVWQAWRDSKKAAEQGNRAFLTESGFLFLDDFITECFSLL